MNKIILKNNQKAIIRRPTLTDAKDMIKYLNTIGGESDFLTFGKNEFNISIESEENYIQNSNSSQNSITIVVAIDNEIVSIASISSSSKDRLKHNGILGISVLEKYWGLGIGNESMNYLIEWAKSNTITKRIELKVREDNYKAISLYEKFGFEKEGVLKKENYINGIYYNTMIMALYLDK